MKKIFKFAIPILLFSLIWGAVEFFIPVIYSKAHISVPLVSILFAISSAISLILDIPAGKLSDLVGRERMIMISMIVAAIAFAFLYFFSSFSAFLIASILIGISYGLNWSPLLAFVGDRAGTNDHGGVFGNYFALSAIGEAVAPMATVAIVIASSIAFPFLVLAILAALCALIFMKLIPRSPHPQKHSSFSNSRFSYRNTWDLIKKNPAATSFLFVSAFLVAFFWESVWFSQPLIGFYSRTLLDSALIVVTFSIPSILFSKPLGMLIDKIGEKKVFFVSILATIVSFFLFYESATLPEKIISIFIAAIGVLGVWLVLDILAVKANDKKDRGEFFGILETVRDLSYVITPLFIGFTYQAIGLNGIFFVNSMIAILLLGFGTYFFGK